jgi:hypothetical protein
MPESWVWKNFSKERVLTNKGRPKINAGICKLCDERFVVSDGDDDKKLFPQQEA